MALRRSVAFFVICGTLADAIPTVTFPLNSQVPPVARVSELFSYTFSISTFSSTLPITYTLSSGPGWLSMDSSTRTLFGTPGPEDAGPVAVTGVAIDITASDSSGSITQSVTLVISTNPAPVVSIPLSEQFQSFSAFSAPSTLLFHPSTPFSFNFQPGTFSEHGGGSALSYYAVTLTNTPLPSWLSFDESSLTFTGQTPDYYSLIQPPQTFSIQLIASDVEGFAGTSINFDIEVGVHLLAFKDAALTLNTTVGETINFDGLSANLQMDGEAAYGSNLASATAQTPSWLVFDNSTLAISGTVPNNAMPCNITVQVTDKYGDTANANVYIEISTSIFSKGIGALNATIGLSFAYELSVYLQNKSDVVMTAQFSTSETWLSFDSQNFILSGQVPSSSKPSTIDITLLAVSKSSQESGSQSFGLVLVSINNQAFPSLTSNVSSASQTGNLPSPAGSREGMSERIILATLIPTISLILCILLTLFCYASRRRVANRQPAKLSKSEISRPLEAPSSVLEIERPPYIEPPKPLVLDITGFGAENSVVTTTKQPESPKVVRKQDIRRSQTLSAVSSARLSQLQESESSGNRERSRSDNALSKADSNWRSTQDSAYPTVASSRTNSSKTKRLTRNYSNYSRKGHSRRSARLFSSDLIFPLEESNTSSQPTEDSILSLRDSNFSFAPIERFSIIKKHGSIQKMPETAHASNRVSRTQSTRRESRFMPAASQPLSGIGHGGHRESISSLTRNTWKWRGVGHGQDWSSEQGFSRNSKTWLATTSPKIDEQHRRSAISGLSEYENMNAEDSIRRSTIRQVTKSPSIPLSACIPVSSELSRNSRSWSRRVGSSPFFSGSATRKSRRLPKKVRKSYADSPTVPEEVTMTGNLDEAVLQGLGEEGDDISRDPFGISYGLACEGTRQLRSYIQSQTSLSRTKASTKSNDSKDSRFESASGSLMSLDQFQAQQTPDDPGGDNEYEYSLPDEFSEGSWETHHSVLDSQSIVVEPREVIEAETELGMTPNWIPRLLHSNPTPPMVDMGPDVRMAPSASRRPISVDAKANKSASRAKIEKGDLDYTAFI